MQSSSAGASPTALTNRKYKLDHFQRELVKNPQAFERKDGRGMYLDGKLVYLGRGSKVIIGEKKVGYRHYILHKILQYVGKRPKELSCKEYHHRRLCKKSMKLQERLSKQFDATIPYIDAKNKFVFTKRGAISHPLPRQIITQYQQGGTLSVNTASGKHLEVFPDIAGVNLHLEQLLAEFIDNWPIPDEPKELQMQLVENLKAEIKPFAAGQRSWQKVLDTVQKRNEDLLKAQISSNPNDAPGKTIVTPFALNQWKALTKSLLFVLNAEAKKVCYLQSDKGRMSLMTVTPLLGSDSLEFTALPPGTPPAYMKGVASPKVNNAVETTSDDLDDSGYFDSIASADTANNPVTDINESTSQLQTSSSEKPPKIRTYQQPGADRLSLKGIIVQDDLALTGQFKVTINGESVQVFPNREEMEKYRSFLSAREKATKELFEVDDPDFPDISKFDQPGKADKSVQADNLKSKGPRIAYFDSEESIDKHGYKVLSVTDHIVLESPLGEDEIVQVTTSPKFYTDGNQQDSTIESDQVFTAQPTAGSHTFSAEEHEVLEPGDIAAKEGERITELANEIVPEPITKNENDADPYDSMDWDDEFSGFLNQPAMVQKREKRVATKKALIDFAPPEENTTFNFREEPIPTPEEMREKPELTHGEIKEVTETPDDFTSLEETVDAAKKSHSPSPVDSYSWRTIDVDQTKKSKDRKLHNKRLELVSSALLPKIEKFNRKKMPLTAKLINDLRHNQKTAVGFKTLEYVLAEIVWNQVIPPQEISALKIPLHVMLETIGIDNKNTANLKDYKREVYFSLLAKSQQALPHQQQQLQRMMEKMPVNEEFKSFTQLLSTLKERTQLKELSLDSMIPLDMQAAERRLVTQYAKGVVSKKELNEAGVSDRSIVMLLLGVHPEAPTDAQFQILNQLRSLGKINQATYEEICKLIPNGDKLRRQLAIIEILEPTSIVNLPKGMEWSSPEVPNNIVSAAWTREKMKQYFGDPLPPSNDATFNQFYVNAFTHLNNQYGAESCLKVLHLLGGKDKVNRLNRLAKIYTQDEVIKLVQTETPKALSVTLNNKLCQACANGKLSVHELLTLNFTPTEILSYLSAEQVKALINARELSPDTLWEAGLTEDELKINLKQIEFLKQHTEDRLFTIWTAEGLLSPPRVIQKLLQLHQKNTITFVDLIAAEVPYTDIVTVLPAEQKVSLCLQGLIPEGLVTEELAQCNFHEMLGVSENASDNEICEAIVELTDKESALPVDKKTLAPQKSYLVLKTIRRSIMRQLGLVKENTRLSENRLMKCARQLYAAGVIDKSAMYLMGFYDIELSKLQEDTELSVAWSKFPKEVQQQLLYLKSKDILQTKALVSIRWPDDDIEEHTIPASPAVPSEDTVPPSSAAIPAPPPPLPLAPAPKEPAVPKETSPTSVATDQVPAKAGTPAAVSDDIPGGSGNEIREAILAMSSVELLDAKHLKAYYEQTLDTIDTDRIKEQIAEDIISGKLKKKLNDDQLTFVKGRWKKTLEMKDMGPFQQYLE